MPKSTLKAPFLKTLALKPEKVQQDAFPFDRLEYLQRDDFSLRFEGPVTLFVGENGSGKSTLLEAIAQHCGFHAGGGSEQHRLHETADDAHSTLAGALRLSWLPKVNRGFFFRADTFAGVARYLDVEARSSWRAGKPLLEHSHGESLLALFKNWIDETKQGIFLLDEPEAAFSPIRQLAFLRVMHDWAATGNAQLIVATHSPILMAYPGAQILSFDGGAIAPVEYEETEHYRVTKSFLANPKSYVADLLSDDDEEEEGT